ncbi:hypothetical protein GLOTRDRAFT_121058 [Gloeophyllum trabeum ATCC 11539]|uniref:Uncharacterized protein n=1 Tax=Gloeophyllum trabeum (strain ATCC 11539 / FP-39264 / Madison 617) TaxID=670483 RepID=S7QBF5_GLOTA|nr:uncharacterized protein GLOTRDRAFT_121058 [Gloeophyllum trabeum ATCC 11539]EPQ56688.1 hypothetical protein GLOTRDRAFT_121058 [Gloeophyllum trabeum ATCC 11539]
MSAAMKSCLKHSPPSSPLSRDGGDAASHSDPCSPRPTPSRPSYKRKSVSFCDQGQEEVFIADEWDRTPAEVTQKLSYQDVLELKQLQLSLPHAPQPPDPFSPRPHTHVEYLRRVPIRLMPLLPETESSPARTPPAEEPKPASPSPPAQSPPTTTHWMQLTSPITHSAIAPAPRFSPHPSPRSSPAPSRTSSPIPSNLPPRAPLRPRPHFAFLPLLPTEEPTKGPEAEPGEMVFSWNDDEETSPMKEKEEVEEKKAAEEEDVARTPHAESVLEGEMLDRVYGAEPASVGSSVSSSAPAAFLASEHDFDQDSVPSSSASVSDGELTADESTPSMTTCSLSPTPSPSPSPPILSEVADTPSAEEHHPPASKAETYGYFQIPTARAENLPYQLKKLRLQALPSPSLMPPSPFELELSAPGGEGEQRGEEGKLEEVHAFERRKGMGRRVGSVLALGLSVKGEGEERRD